MDRRSTLRKLDLPDLADRKRTKEKEGKEEEAQNSRRTTREPSAKENCLSSKCRVEACNPVNEHARILRRFPSRTRLGLCGAVPEEPLSQCCHQQPPTKHGTSFSQPHETRSQPAGPSKQPWPPREVERHSPFPFSPTAQRSLPVAVETKEKHLAGGTVIHAAPRQCLAASGLFKLRAVRSQRLALRFRSSRDV